jgi:hypothetical protein
MNADTRTFGLITVVPHGASSQSVARVSGSGIDFGAGIVPFDSIEATVVTNWLAEAGIQNPDSAEVDAITLALSSGHAESIIEALNVQGVFAQNGGRTSLSSHAAWGNAGRVVTGIVILVLWGLGMLRLVSLMRVLAPRVGKTA